MSPERSIAELSTTRALGEIQADVAAMVGALQMVAQGHIYRGSVKHDLDAAGMQNIAAATLHALGDDGGGRISA